MKSSLHPIIPVLVFKNITIIVLIGIPFTNKTICMYVANLIHRDSYYVISVVWNLFIASVLTQESSIDMNCLRSPN